jgi:hypothetical protein
MTSLWEVFEVLWAFCALVVRLGPEGLRVASGPTFLSAALWAPRVANPGVLRRVGLEGSRDGTFRWSDMRA